MKNFNRHSMETKNNQTQNLGGKKMKAKKLILGLVALSILSFAVSANAGVPQMINYQGVLTDQAGCRQDGKYGMVFCIYDAETGGDPLWEEVHADGDSVTVTRGNFNVLLGSLDSIPNSLFLNDLLWLEVEVNGEKMEPRQRIASVGYAFRSEFADTADHCWSISDDDWDGAGTGKMYTHFLTDSVGIGTDIPGAKLHVVGGGFLLNTDQIGGYYCRIDGNEITGGTAGGPPSSHHLHVKPGDNSSYLLLAEDGGNVGIGTTSPSEELHVDGNVKVTGRINKAVFQSGAASYGGYDVAVDMAGNNMDQGEVHFGNTGNDQWVDMWFIYSNGYLMGNFVKYGGVSPHAGHFRLSSSGVIVYSGTVAGTSAGYAYWSETNYDVRIYETYAGNNHCEWWSYDRRN